MVQERLRKRTAVAASLGTAISSAVVAAANLEAEPWRTTAILAPQPLFSLLMVCLSPAASDGDLSSPVLQRALLCVSMSSAVAALGTWMTAARGHPCGSIALLTGVLACLAHFSVPVFGVLNARSYWPAHRIALITSGVLQLARVAVQARALRLAGSPELLPAPMAAECEQHDLFLPGEIPRAAALGVGVVWLFMGLALTPATRTRMARLAGRFGLPAARVLHLNDGILLAESDEKETSRADSACCSFSSSSSGLFAGKASSLWSGWSDSWSDKGEASQAVKLSRYLGPTLRLLPGDRDEMARQIQAAKASLAEAEVSKAKRRAAHYGKAYGKLVWLLLRRAQRRSPQHPLALLPRDALRMILANVIEDETTRLKQLYSGRLLAGSSSFRG